MRHLAERVAHKLFRLSDKLNTLPAVISERIEPISERLADVIELAAVYIRKQAPPDIIFADPESEIQTGAVDETFSFEIVTDDLSNFSFSSESVVHNLVLVGKMKACAKCGHRGFTPEGDDMLECTNCGALHWRPKRPKN